MAHTLPPPPGPDRDRRWTSLLATAQRYLPGALRLLGVPAQDIDDVLQDVLLAAYLALDRFDPSRGARARRAAAPALATPLEPDGSPPATEEVCSSTAPAPAPTSRDEAPPCPTSRRTAEMAWLFGIAWRQVRHHLERAYRRRETPRPPKDFCFQLPPVAPCFHSPGLAPSPEQALAAGQRFALAVGLLERVPARRRVVLVLKDAFDLSIEEISALLHVKPATTRNRLRLARNDYRAAAMRLRPDARWLLRPGLLLGLVFPALLLRAAVAEAAASPSPGSRCPPSLDPGSPSSPLAPGRALTGPAVGGWVAGAATVTPFLLLASATSPEAGAPRAGEATTEVAAVYGAETGDRRATSPPVPGFAALGASPLAPTAAPVPSSPLSPDPLAEERRLLASAQRALARANLARALHFLSAHEWQFPRGQLAATREVLRARAKRLASERAALPPPERR